MSDAKEILDSRRVASVERFTTWGAISGCCGHLHRTLGDARECAAAAMKAANGGAAGFRVVRVVRAESEADAQAQIEQFGKDGPGRIPMEAGIDVPAAEPPTERKNVLPAGSRELAPDEVDKVFHDVFNAYSRQILALAYGITGDHHAAQDITQESFVKFHARLQNGPVDGRVIVWLRKVATNASLKLQLQRQKWPDELDDTVGEIADWPRLTIEERERYREIAVALKGLPDSQRIVFELRVYDKMAYRDIADLLGCGAEAAKKTYQRVRKKILKKVAR